jgi:hypothetical protein
MRMTSSASGGREAIHPRTAGSRGSGADRVSELPCNSTQKAIYVVQVQLEKAGVRLAAVLNEALR